MQTIGNLKLSDKAVQIHLYEFSNVLRPRGHMKKESIGVDILDRLMGAYESWTDKKYGDNPDTTTLLKLLRRNMEEEMEGAWKEFIDELDIGVDEDMISKDMIKRIQVMANATWDVIASDVLTLLRDQAQSEEMDRSEVVDVVCDAGYMLAHGNDPDAYTYWKNLPPVKRTEIVTSAFPCQTYGW